MYAYVLPFLNPAPAAAPIPPLKTVLEDQVELPMLHSSFPLAVYITYGNKKCFNATFSIHPTLSFPRCVHKFVLYVFVSMPALQIGSSVLFL